MQKSFTCVTSAANTSNIVPIFAFVGPPRDARTNNSVNNTDTGGQIGRWRG